MIVKNESKIIERALDSVIDVIDFFCIVDTGSTDDTVEKIMTYFKRNGKIKGRLGFTEFENFEKTRNYAMKMAEGIGDYLLFLDADMVLNHSIDKNKLTKDYYAIYQDNVDVLYHNTRIVKNNDCFYYRGVTHEVILSKESVEGDILKESVAKIMDFEDGGCKENKLLRDKELLLNNLEDQETKGRYYFYLANTLMALEEFDESEKYYIKRIRMQGWDQEVWCCCYKIGCINYIKKDINKSIFYLLEAYNYAPKRVENLYYLIIIYVTIKKINIAKIYLNLALDIIKDKKFNEGDLFLEKRFYSEELFSPALLSLG
tara:strand:+ start:77 stop:1024 length:948 start_codon:yes stop_codon:yes gene_type:complete